MIMLNLTGFKPLGEYDQITKDEYIKARTEMMIKGIDELLNGNGTKKRKCTKKVQDEK